MMTTTQHDQLSKRDLIGLTSLSYRSLECQNHEDLKELVLGLQSIFDFGNALYAYANVPGLFSNKTKHAVKAFNISFPQDFVNNYIKNRVYLADAAIRELMNNSKPVGAYMPIDNYSANNKCSKEYASFIKRKRRTSANTWIHGVHNTRTQGYVGFSFVCKDNKNEKRVCDILKYIVPFYSEAFYRITKNENNVSFDLTSREIEILKWIKEGKSSWEISTILQCSKRTVDFHAENAKVKLNAMSRPQAIAIALHNGVISF